eukprot:UN5093
MPGARPARSTTAQRGSASAGRLVPCGWTSSQRSLCLATSCGATSSSTARDRTFTAATRGHCTRCSAAVGGIWCLRRNKDAGRCVRPKQCIQMASRSCYGAPRRSSGTSSSLTPQTVRCRSWACK